MITVPVYSIKGGVGKTASAVNLAYLAAESGRRVLLWDLDAQGAATFYMGQEPKIRGGVSRLMEKGHELASNIVDSPYQNLSLVPSDFSLRNIDHHLDEGRNRTRKLKRLIEGIPASAFDLLFIDSPPGITLLSENILEAADVLLTPLIPTVLSERTHDELTRFCEAQRFACRILPFFSMVDKRKRLHLEYLMELDRRKTPFLKSFIPYASIVEQMGIRQAPVVHFARSAYASKCYEDLWSNLRRYLKG